MEPHSLWEYPCTAVGTPENVMEFTLTSTVPTEQIVKKLTLVVEENKNLEKSLNGM